MKLRNFLLCLVSCLLLTVFALGADRTVTVNRADGVSRTAAVSVPDGAEAWCVSFDSAGRMLKAEIVSGTSVSADSGTETMKLMILNEQFAPCAPPLEISFRDNGQLPVGYVGPSSPDDICKSVVCYNADNSVRWRVEYHLDRSTNSMEVVSFDANNQQVSTLTVSNVIPGRETDHVSYYTITGELSRNEVEYDADGHLIHYKSYNRNGDLEIERIEQYNDKGQLIREEHHLYMEGWVSSTTISFEYDSIGRIIHETDVDEHGDKASSSSSTYYYDYEYEGNHARCNHYYFTQNGKSDSTGYDLITYNNYLKPLRTESYNYEGKLQSYTLQQYDNEGMFQYVVHYAWQNNYANNKIMIPSHEAFYQSGKVVRSNAYNGNSGKLDYYFIYYYGN